MTDLTVKPPWQVDHESKPGHDPATGRFLPGHSGNPAGREKGSKNKRTLLREELEKHGSQLAQAIKRKALEEGDSSCMSMWLARLEAPLRSTGKCVEFELDADASIAEQAKQIIVAVSRGEVDIDTARELMNLLSAYCGLRDIECFMDELRKLKETKHGNHIPGGVHVVR